MLILLNLLDFLFELLLPFFYFYCESYFDYFDLNGGDGIEKLLDFYIVGGYYIFNIF